MTPGEIVVLTLIVAIFVIFSLVLAWVSWGSGAPARRGPAESAAKDPPGGSLSIPAASRK